MLFEKAQSVSGVVSYHRINAKSSHNRTSYFFTNITVNDSFDRLEIESCSRQTFTIHSKQS